MAGTELVASWTGLFLAGFSWCRDDEWCLKLSGAIKEPTIAASRWKSGCLVLMYDNSMATMFSTMVLVGGKRDLKLEGNSIFAMKVRKTLEEEEHKRSLHSWRFWKLGLNLWTCKMKLVLVLTFCTVSYGLLLPGHMILKSPRGKEQNSFGLLMNNFNSPLYLMTKIFESFGRLTKPRKPVELQDFDWNTGMFTPRAWLKLKLGLK